MHSFITQRVIGAALSLIIFAGVLAFSFSPTTGPIQSMTGPVFAVYIGLLVVAVLFWKRLKGWADGYVGGFALGVVVWAVVFVIKAISA